MGAGCCGIDAFAFIGAPTGPCGHAALSIEFGWLAGITCACGGGANDIGAGEP
jgi:hypothetical protein